MVPTQIPNCLHLLRQYAWHHPNSNTQCMCSPTQHNTAGTLMLIYPHIKLYTPIYQNLDMSTHTHSKQKAYILYIVYKYGRSLHFWVKYEIKLIMYDHKCNLILIAILIKLLLMLLIFSVDGNLSILMVPILAIM